MRAAGFGEDGAWRRYPELWEALGLERLLAGRREPLVISVAGAGGKTTLIRRLAWECRQRTLPVLVTTTTHMYRPERFAALGGAGEAEKLLEQRGLAVFGRPSGAEKIAFPGWEECREAGRRAAVILSEADGSRRLALKAPGKEEPVILPDTALILCVYGLSCLGRRGREVCFRLEEAERICPGLGERPVQEEDLVRLMAQGYCLPLERRYPKARCVPVFHQADTLEQESAARRMLEALGGRGGRVFGGLREDVSAGLF